MIKPMADYILIDVEKGDNKTDSGIVLMTAQPENFKRGTIVEVNELSEMIVGSKVLYKEWAGFEIEHGGKKFLLVAEEDLLAEVEE